MEPNNNPSTILLLPPISCAVLGFPFTLSEPWLHNPKHEELSSVPEWQLLWEKKLLIL